MTTETLTEERQIQRLCDKLVETAAKELFDAGAPVPMILDRMLTYAAAQACQIDGVRNTAQVFRQLADTIESGIFDRFEKPEGTKH